MSDFPLDEEIFLNNNPLTSLNSTIVVWEIDKQHGQYDYYLYINALDIKLRIGLGTNNQHKLIQYLIDNHLIHLCQNTNIRDEN